MKKSIAIVAVMVAFVFAAPANAQLQFGVKGGLNISKVKFDKDVIDTDNRAGFFFGPTADFSLPIVGLGMDASLLYEQKGMKADDVTETLHYIDVPINLKYSIGLGSLASVFVTTGPQFAFNVGGKKILENSYSLKSSQFSWNVGAGAKLIKHIQIAYNYNIGLGATAEMDVKTAAGAVQKAALGKLKNNTHQISIAYMF